jgi:hypothetical protein
MRKTFEIDEAEYKRACKEGAKSLIKLSMRPYAENAEVNEIDGAYWLSYDFNEIRYRATITQQEDAYLNGFSCTVV